jgi:hypothetical protein
MPNQRTALPKPRLSNTRSMQLPRCRDRGLLTVLVLCSLNAHATENGGNSYPMGVETNYNGLMLPQGAHWFAYYSHYEAVHFKNNAGVDSPQLARFHLSSNVVAPRLSYVWPGVTFLGADVETRVVQPTPTTCRTPGWSTATATVGGSARWAPASATT